MVSLSAILDALLKTFFPDHCKKYKVKDRQAAVSDSSKEHKCLLPARYVMALLTFFGFFVLYAMSVDLSVTIIKMANSSALLTTEQADPSEEMACPELLQPSRNETAAEGPKGDGEFFWDAATQGFILSAFFYGYIIPQIPAGILAQRWSAKWTLGLGVLLMALMTLVTPLAASLGATCLFVVRVGLGLGAGAIFPAANTLIGRWSPVLERSTIASLIYLGVSLGTVVSMALSGWIADSAYLGGWPSVFYVLGVVSLIWLFFWSIFVYDRPSDHPSISHSELKLIMEGQSSNSEPKAVPWKAILTSVPVWALVLTHFGQNWGYNTLMTEMPTYLSTMMHFEVKKNGLLSSLPYILKAVFSVVSSCIADSLRRRGCLGNTTTRKIMNSIAFGGPCLLMLAVTYAGCRPELVVFLFCTTMGLNGFIYAGFSVTNVDMSPDHAGTLMGIANGLSNISGLLAPMVVGQLTSKGQTLGNWGSVFLICAGMYAVTGIIYDVFSSSDLQPWDSSYPAATADAPTATADANTNDSVPSSDEEQTATESPQT